MKRKTQRTRFIRKLKGLRILAKRRRHFPLAQQHRWLASVLRGHYAYYGLPSNHSALDAFYEEVKCLWYRALRRRSQRGLTWSRFKRILELFPLPEPRITPRLKMRALNFYPDSRMLGSVRAKAEWLSYSTIPLVWRHSLRECAHRQSRGESHQDCVRSPTSSSDDPAVASRRVFSTPSRPRSRPSGYFLRMRGPGTLQRPVRCWT